MSKGLSYIDASTRVCEKANELLAEHFPDERRLDALKDDPIDVIITVATFGEAYEEMILALDIDAIVSEVSLVDTNLALRLAKLPNDIKIRAAKIIRLLYQMGQALLLEVDDDDKGKEEEVEIDESVDDEK